MIQQASSTPESLTIVWTPASDGGEEQWFYVNYRHLPSTTGFDPGTRSIRLYGVNEYTLVGLRPEAAYEVEVYAENANGASDGVKAEGITLRKPHFHPHFPSHPVYQGPLKTERA